MRFALLALLISTQAFADDMEARSEFDSIPTTNCTVTVYTPPEEGASPPNWNRLQAPSSYRQDRYTTYGTRAADGSSEGQLMAIDGFVELKMGLRRNAQRNWVSSVRPIAASGTNVYLTPVPSTGPCTFRGGRVLRANEVTPQGGLTMADDRPEARSEKRRLKNENRGDGSSIGLEVACTQAHNPVRDAERRDDTAAGAGGGSGGSKSKKAN